MRIKRASAGTACVVHSTPYRRTLAAAFFLLLLFPLISAAKKKAPDHPIDLNAATEKELEELPGVGPTTAKAIIEFREKSGKFKRVDDLLVIRGISEAKLARIRPYVVIGPPPAAIKPNAPSLPRAGKSTSNKSQ